MELVLVITFIPLFAMNSDVKLITMIIINNGVLVRYWDMTKLPRLNRWVIPNIKRKGIVR